MDQLIAQLPARRPRWLGTKPIPDPSHVSRRELRMGVKEESEHTHRKVLALIIALDHLHENPRYYSKLKKCMK